MTYRRPTQLIAILLLAAAVCAAVWAARFDPRVSDPQSSDPATGDPLPAVPATQGLPPIDQFAVIWDRWIDWEAEYVDEDDPLMQQALPADLRLLGTGQEGDQTRAVLWIDGRSRVVRLGDLVPGGRVEAIEPRSVQLRGDNGLTTLSLPEPAP